MKLSPKYKMELRENIYNEVWKKYKTYSDVEIFLREFIKYEWQSYGNYEAPDFEIIYKGDTKNIDVKATLANVPQDTLIEIAIELDITVPMVIPAYPTFIRVLQENEKGFSYAYDIFNKAHNLILEDPAQAVSLANSGLESIIKQIMRDDSISKKIKETSTLYELTESVLKEFSFYPSNDVNKSIKTIGSSFLNISKQIENLRSDATFSHGKKDGDYIIDNSLYSSFIVNAATTVGLFLISFYEEKYQSEASNEEIPF